MASCSSSEPRWGDRQVATTGRKFDVGSTSSSYKRKGIPTSYLNRPIPSKASRRLAGCDPEVALYPNLEKAQELKTKNDQFTNGVQGGNLAGNE
ncbi:hypothetical protein ACH5RR_037347 [Cinchona calisaya]|uniref:Uncharacterized protein n=1 Tax=Cinchona calisaya TaxID=153742 RepID=A0ABD2Y760_9GENT